MTDEWMEEFGRLLQSLECAAVKRGSIYGNEEYDAARAELMAHVETMRNEGDAGVHFTGHNMLAAAQQPVGDQCDVPPIGWRCTRAKGHDGPCAAVEDRT